ncbi:MAG: hypothetical protein AB9828_00960 [Sphaerochaetaceae bacterium]
MKKSLMVLLVLLVVGSVMFADVSTSPVKLTGETSGTTTMEVLAENGEQTAFTLTQTDGFSGSLIDLTVNSNFRASGSTGIPIGNWKIGSNHAGGLKLSWETDGGFKITVDGEDYIVPYMLTVATEEDPILASDLGLNNTVGVYDDFAQDSTSGVYDVNDGANKHEIRIYPTDNSTVYIASSELNNYATTITFKIAAE